MKTIITTVLVASILIFGGCKEEVKSASTTSETATTNNEAENNSKKNSKDQTLTQQGNYETLFNREAKNCDFITSEILADALQVSSNTIEADSDNCTYYLIDNATGDKTRFRFVIESWGNNKIKKAIKMAKEKAEALGENSRTGHFRISDTGDTYLSVIHNKRICILNEAQENVITIYFFPPTAFGETDKNKVNTLRDIARDQAYAIANALLKTHLVK